MSAADTEQPPKIGFSKATFAMPLAWLISQAVPSTVSQPEEFFMSFRRALFAAALAVDFCAVLALALVAFAPSAFAQTASDIADAICSPSGKSYLIWLIGLVGFVRLLTVFRQKIASLPPGVQAVVHLVALNWRTAVEMLAQAMGYVKPSAKVLILVMLLPAALALSACQITGNPAVDMQAWGKQIQKFNADFAAKAAAFNAKVVATVVPAGKAACGFANEANGFFQSTMGQVAVQAGEAIAHGGVSQAADVQLVNASEQATWTKVQQACAIVDAMNPAQPTQDEIATVAVLIQTVPQLSADLAKISPAAATLIKPAGA